MRGLICLLVEVIAVIISVSTGSDKQDVRHQFTVFHGIFVCVIFVKNYLYYVNLHDISLHDSNISNLTPLREGSHHSHVHGPKSSPESWFIHMYVYHVT